MTKRMQKIAVGILALAALALGGSVFAQAQSGSAPPAKAANVQSTPDNPGESEQPEANEQPGSETESGPDDDGPGGHADEANGGDAGANHEFQGQE